MATNDDTGRGPDGDETLPDEDAVIAERIEELGDTERHLSVEEVADELDIDTD